VRAKNGIRNGSTGSTTTLSSHNFFFNNTVIDASISSELYGEENYSSQNRRAEPGSESFFNSAE
jgi:hypothetical protein